MAVAAAPEGHDKRYCGAKKRQGDGNCARPAGWGTDHVGEGPCKLHGGSTRSVSAPAKLRLVEREARELFGQIVPEARPVENPLAAYAAFAGRVMAWMELMDSLLDDLTRVGYESEYSGTQISAVVELYERAMDRANTVLSSYARLKIDERLVAIAERQKQMVIGAVEAGLRSAGVEGEKADAAKLVVARALRAVPDAA